MSSREALVEKFLNRSFSICAQDFAERLKFREAVTGGLRTSSSLSTTTSILLYHVSNL